MKFSEALPRVGFMQGRLSAPLKGRIQCFPISEWKQEIALGKELGFSFLEWTLDKDTWEENPLLAASGRVEIKALLRATEMKAPSLTGDCFMEAPFYKAQGKYRQALLDELDLVLESAAEIGVKQVVMPLVDHGAIETESEEALLYEALHGRVGFLKSADMQVIFESDFGPAALMHFISSFAPRYFGINYDMGNSAALGHDPLEEISAYGSRILNVHVKDRRWQGTTVPLGTGHTQFERVFESLGRVGYRGNYVLQTARASDGNHSGIAIQYRDRVVDWIEQYGG